MLWRKINLELLFKSGLAYRMLILIAQTLFFWGITGQLKVAFGDSVIWNGINLILYYLYYYMFTECLKWGLIDMNNRHFSLPV